MDSNIPVYVSSYPPGKVKYISKYLPQGYRMAIETLGKFSRFQEPGWFFVLPAVQKIKYVLDTREFVVDIFRQHAYTSDNVQINIAAQLYVQFVDTYKACYNIKQLLVAVISHVQSAMRSSVGKHDLDHLLKDRNNINRDVFEALVGSEKNWGVKINRVEITELTPDAKIAFAMDLQATAERERRQTVKNAEAKKQAMELEAEGQKIKLINEAEGRARSLEIETHAQMLVVDEMVKRSVVPQNALLFQLTAKYIEGLNHLAKDGKHTTYFMGRDMLNVNAMTNGVIDALNTTLKKE